MRVGIIGGGQLAMMLCEAATKLGIKTTVLDTNPKCSSSYVCDALIESEYDDIEGLEQLAASCDVVTYEFENVDCAGIDYINNKYQNVIQTSLPLQLSNDRLVEKQAAMASGFKPARFKAVEQISDISLFSNQVGYPIVLKTRRFGYDGKGQVILKDAEDLKLEVVQDIVKAGAIAEEMIDLDYELSVIAIRNKAGDMKFIPSPINSHVNNILFTSKIKCGETYPEVEKLVKQYIEYHKLIGIITVEVFVDASGEIYFNEIAPRPHNSGHYSIEGCDHSQFEMHIRGICDLELPEVKVVDESVMVNVLGQDYEFAKEWIGLNDKEQIYFHDYFKEGAAHNRKMAHITAVGSEAVQSLNEYIRAIKERNE